MANEFSSAGIIFKIGTNTIAGCQGTPDMGSEPEKIDVTTFDNDTYKTYIEGLMDLQSLDFDFIDQTTNFNSAKNGRGRSNDIFNRISRRRQVFVERNAQNVQACGCCRGRCQVPHILYAKRRNRLYGGRVKSNNNESARLRRHFLLSVDMQFFHKGFLQNLGKVDVLAFRHCVEPLRNSKGFLDSLRAVKLAISDCIT